MQSFKKSMAFAAGAFVVAGLMTPPADAGFNEPVSQGDCLMMAGRVSHALAGDTYGASADAARREAAAGKSECREGFFGSGVDHYSQALQLLEGRTGAHPSAPSDCPVVPGKIGGAQDHPCTPRAN